MQKQILVADDESLIRDFISSFFASIPEYSEYKIDMSVNGEDAIAKIKNKKYDLIFTDLKMPIKTGLDVLKYVAEHSPDTDTVLLTAYGGPESAAQAMAYGAYEYITKPISIEELEMIVKHIFERQALIAENQKLQKTIKDAQHYSKIIGKSKRLSDIMDLVKMVAPTNSTVLITGESGTGKELIAEAIHMLSPRNKGNFIKINCAAIPESLIESELFGFEKGAFTGAIKSTRGKFELADKGSILLDEISEMNLDLQAKLLRVIQEREIVRIGTEMPIKIDTRIIATSNRDLVEEVNKGNFREDLFFRLNIVPIHLPSLKYRKDDIPNLVENFIKKVCFELGVNKKSISQEALNLLMDYSWPGNIRELQNAIERACITNPDAVLKKDSFLFLSQQAGRFDKNDNDEKTEICYNEDDDNWVNIDNKTIERIEKEVILKTLNKTGNSRQDTARILGITTRTLRNKLDIYNVEDGENY
ncbi:MAG: sigma-54 dependent transcriptional regulator [Candidatus Cloacimonadales bacterium]|nr:sigma-54 dependent transcriptional regulator [Candidatus Cloacimonadota bacterium]MDD2649719.1 sigma-54 dependent transcriptional regulator [Candidatus Cloacimonadota bacterium]MDD3500802.1 sigma-54 dependent transcriptional regulator [Candidatus Cloacimonadota bacterium]MDX9977296.1 sigma-54 dependent transcriptional regulator [Candidatus Cloacimonadales bacterium]